ncbi:ABC transporter ATP-binding protein [Aquimonas sp.]|uniref:ABC transporter ATP-binding protein n=1 Tax=Aquimonas sp. TaxID=1872588 RepID=UPI0037BE89A1
MSAPLLAVRNLGKGFKRYPGAAARLIELLLPWGRPRHELRWVLRGVSFEVRAGETVGILGYNGAGKSTLLKIIAGVSKPSTGEVIVNGPVAALLELGMGFHPDFTGRENVRMAGHILGLDAAELERRMQEIEDFAEIGDYIDQPVRTYSSGMQVRLAFSVATCVRPSILIVDEALSVGDAYFQHKSFARIREFRDAGTTLLFVSHSPGAIKSLCDRAILLDAGGVVRDGEPSQVLDYYNAIIAKREAEAEIREVEVGNGRKATRSGGLQARILGIELLNHQGEAVRAVHCAESATLRIRVQAEQALDSLTAGILLRDALGNDVFGTNTFHHSAELGPLVPGDQRTVDFQFPQLHLGQGSYSVSAALHERDVHTAGNYDWWDQAIVFQVIRDDTPYSIGVCKLPVTVTVV